jgi:HEAT repeat protein
VFKHGPPRREEMRRRGDETWEERLLEARDNRDVGYLIPALNDERWHAPAYFANLEAPEAIPAFSRMLHARDPERRLSAVRALGRLRATSAQERILELARTDEARYVRLWSVAALGEIGDTKMFETLVSFLADEDRGVRHAAAVGLGHLGDARATAHLSQAKRREGVRSRGPYRRALRTLRARATGNE